MILVTVGTQLPFDRLIRMMDEMAPELDEPVIAQIGRAHYEPVNMEWHRVIPPLEFEPLVDRARVIVSHAGIGTILTAERHGRSLILFPRAVEMGEHRNDHQMATASAMSGREGVAVARDAADLRRLIAHPPPPARPSRDMAGREGVCAEIARFLQSCIGPV